MQKYKTKNTTTTVVVFYVALKILLKSGCQGDFYKGLGGIFWKELAKKSKS